MGYEGQSFEAYKKGLRDRYKSIKKHLLLPYQKVFYVRLDSQIEERNDWLNNMVSGVLRKSLRDISDEEEVVLYEKLSATFQELDNLCDIHKIEINRAKEEVVKIEITSLDAGTKPYQVRLNKRKLDEAEVLESKIRPLLSKDASINKRVLIKLLQEILD